MSCSRTQHGGGRSRTPDLSLRSPILYHWATALPWTCMKRQGFNFQMIPAGSTECVCVCVVVGDLLVGHHILLCLQTNLKIWGAVLLFIPYLWISENTFLDIQKSVDYWIHIHNSILGYPKMNYRYPKIHPDFWISINQFFDIQKSVEYWISISIYGYPKMNYGYPKIHPNF